MAESSTCHNSSYHPQFSPNLVSSLSSIFFFHGPPPSFALPHFALLLVSSSCH